MHPLRKEKSRKSMISTEVEAKREGRATIAGRAKRRLPARRAFPRPIMSVKLLWRQLLR